MIPNLTEIIKRLVIERDALRSSFPSYTRTQRTNPPHQKLPTDRTRPKSLNHAHTNVTLHVYIWSIIKSLNGKLAEIDPYHPITLSSKSFSRNVEIATAFAKHFIFSVSHSSNPSFWIVRRKLHKECSVDNMVSHFFPDIVSQAIKNHGNSLATGPGALPITHLKNLSSLGLQFLTHLYNLSIKILVYFSISN